MKRDTKFLAVLLLWLFPVFVEAQSLAAPDADFIIEQMRGRETFQELTPEQQERVEIMVSDSSSVSERPDSERLQAIGFSPCTEAEERDVSGLPVGITRISVSNYPPISEKEITVSVCIRAFEPYYSYENVTLLLTLKDGEGTLLREFRYDGDVVAIPLSVYENVLLDKISDTLVVQAELRGGDGIIDRHEKTYICGDAQLCSNPTSGSLTLERAVISIPAALFLVALIPIIVFVSLVLLRDFRKKNRKRFFLLVFLFIGSLYFLSGSSVDAADCVTYSNSLGQSCIDCSELQSDGCTFYSSCCGPACFTGGGYSYVSNEFISGWAGYQCPCPPNQEGFIWYWYGSSEPVNMCSDSIVDASCGAAHGTAASTAPTANLCSSGTASAVSGSGPWIWTCSGENGGTDIACSASLYKELKLCSGGESAPLSKTLILDGQPSESVYALFAHYGPISTGCSDYDEDVTISTTFTEDDTDDIVFIEYPTVSGQPVVVSAQAEGSLANLGASYDASSASIDFAVDTSESPITPEDTEASYPSTNWKEVVPGE